MTLDDLVANAADLAVPGRRHLLGLTGGPGSGKSSLAAALVNALGERVRVVAMDGFHLARTELVRLGRLPRKGSPDTFDPLGFLALLTRLRDNTDEVVYAPRFDRALEDPIACAVPVHREVPLVIVEGNYLLLDELPWSGVRRLLDQCWYLDPAAHLRRARLIARHQSYGCSESEARDRALGNDEHNAALIAHSQAHADLVIRACDLSQNP